MALLPERGRADHAQVAVVGSAVAMSDAIGLTADADVPVRLFCSLRELKWVA